MSWLIWLGIAVFLIVIECFTLDLVAIWCAAAALVLTIIAAAFPSLDPVWQIAIFLAITTVLLLSTRRAVKRFMKRRKGQETNLELIIDHTAVVVEEIHNDLGAGEVKINGLVWRARSEDGAVIAKETLVTVKEIAGNKLIVTPKA